MYMQAEKLAHSNLIEVICKELDLRNSVGRRFIQFWPGLLVMPTLTLILTVTITLTLTLTLTLTPTPTLTLTLTLTPTPTPTPTPTQLRTLTLGELGDTLRKDSEPGFYAGTIISGNCKTGLYRVKFDDELVTQSINLIEGTGLTTYVGLRRSRSV